MDDYERKTSDLSLLQRGAYSELIRHYYMIGGPLPANAVQLHRVCRCTDVAEQDAINYCLQRYFRIDEDGWHHDRCDKEIAKSREISEKRSKSAFKMHAQKDKKCDASAHANAPAKADTSTSTREKWVLPKDLEPFKEDWDAYEVMRKKNRKAPTDQARKNVCNKLLQFQAEGFDVGQILQQSVTNNWTDVYQPKGVKCNGTKPSYIEQRLNVSFGRDVVAQKADG